MVVPPVCCFGPSVSRISAKWAEFLAKKSMYSSWQCQVFHFVFEEQMAWSVLQQPIV